MKLWLLRPIITTQRTVSAKGCPWDPWYDKCFGFVVRADTEKQARRFAMENAGNEKREAEKNKTSPPWLDPVYSSCIELTPQGDSGVVIKDFAAA